MRLVGEDALVERQDHAREKEVVCKHRVTIEIAVPLAAFVHTDAAGRFGLMPGVDIEHVAAFFGDVQAAVAVESHRGRADDVRFGEDELQTITWREDETFRLLLGRQRNDRRLGAVVPSDICGVTQTRTARSIATRTSTAWCAT